MSYGWLELAYSKPFADAISGDVSFREWLIRRTKFASLAPKARLLREEIEAKRAAKLWWRSNFTERCRCEGCSGQETDILAIFEAASNHRFAIHIEVKNPLDAFGSKRDQARNYAIRANCWSRNPPKAVLEHSDADTMLLYDASKRDAYASHIGKFGSAVTFDEVQEVFPHAVPTQQALALARTVAEHSKRLAKIRQKG